VRGLGFESYVCQLCVFVIIVLIICWATFLHEIMLELCVLARNISWFGGLALIWHWEGHGFEPW